VRAAAGAARKEVPERFSRTARADPPGAVPPVGYSHFTSRPPGSASTRRLRPRVCLGKDCGRVYQPRRWNQRYCQDPECLKRVRRWQNRRRQQDRRRQAEVRGQQAAAQRQRRQRRRQALTGPTPRDPPPPDYPSDCRAWSRSRKNSAPFCHRPGCYEPLPEKTRAPVRYCGPACRQAVQSVLDRERKWLRRNTPAGRCKRRFEYQARRAARHEAITQPPRGGSCRQERPP
jgi:hypothetical protein